MIVWILFFGALVGCIGFGLWVGVVIGFRTGREHAIKTLSALYTLTERKK